MSNNQNKKIAYWLISGCVIIYFMVLVGCITRLTHSGLSMTHWSVTGGLPPLSESSWQEEFSKYAQSPEFKKINSYMTIEEFKSIYFWEWLHRFIGRALLSGTFLIGFIWFYFRKQLKGKLLLKTVFLFLLGAAQGLIGWWMVKSGLVDNPAVSHYRLAIHLMSAFTCFAFTYWFALQILNSHPVNAVSAPNNQNAKLFPLATVLLVVIITQIIFGAFVAGKKAGLGFATWPTMNGEWFPTESIMIYPSLLTNFFETPAGIQWLHRSFAFVVVTLVGVVWIRSNKLNLSREASRAITLLIYGVTIQFILGVWTLLHQVPVVLGVLHQSGAFFLFVVSIYLIFHLQLYKNPKKIKQFLGRLKYTFKSK